MRLWHPGGHVQMRYAAYAPRGWHALVRARGAVSAKVPASAGVSGEPEAEALSGDKAGYGVGGASAPNTEFLFTFHREEEVGGSILLAPTN